MAKCALCFIFCQILRSTASVPGKSRPIGTWSTKDIIQSDLPYETEKGMGGEVREGKEKLLRLLRSI